MRGDELDLDGADRDLGLITDYLTNGLSPAEREAVERRLVEDGAFFDLAWPLLQAWSAPVHFRELHERRAPGTAPRRVREGPVGGRTDPGTLAGAYAPPPTGRLMRGDVRPYGVAVPDDDAAPARTFGARLRGLADTLTSSGAMMFYSGVTAAVTVAAVAIGSYVANRQPPVDPVTVIQGPVRQQEVPLPNGTLVQAGPGETKVIALRGGSRVEVRPGSSFEYAYLLGRSEVTARLRGEAAFEVSDVERIMRIMTPGGSVMLLRAPRTGGTFAVRCGEGCTALLVTVAGGFASVGGKADTTRVTAGAGQFARSVNGGRPELVTGPDTVGYPSALLARP